MTEPVTPAAFDIGRVLKRTFSVLGHNLAVFLILTVILSGLPQFASSMVQTHLASSGSAQGVLLLVGLALLTLIGAYVLQAAVIHGAVSDLNGRRASLGACLSTGVKFFLPTLAIAILFSFGVAFGFLLLIVPGLILTTMWVVAVPVEVVEKTGVFGSFSRSAALTKGHRWQIFALFLVYVAISAVLVGGLAAVGMSIAGGPGVPVNPLAIAITAVIQSISTLIGAAGVASIYYELRTIKDGIGPEQLASVFD